MVEIAGFEWDAGDWPKCGKHGVAKREIERIILNATYVVDDPPPREPRYRTVGVNENGRHLFLVFTLRERDKKAYIRPISARYMHAREVQSYEEEMARLKE